MIINNSIIKNFWRRVNKTDDCWDWTGCKTDRGYGRLNIRPHQLYAHRFSYEITNGPIPNSLIIDHLCKNHSCVRPDHLEAVSQKENVLRGTGIPAENSKKTHCRHGHEYSNKNTYFYKNGSRSCRECHRSIYCKKRNVLEVL